MDKREMIKKIRQHIDLLQYNEELYFSISTPIALRGQGVLLVHTKYGCGITELISNKTIIDEKFIANVKSAIAHFLQKNEPESDDYIKKVISTNVDDTTLQPKEKAFLVINTCNFDEKSLALSRHNHKHFLDLGFYCCVDNNTDFRVLCSSYTKQIHDKLFSLALNNSLESFPIRLNNKIIQWNNLMIKDINTLSCDNNIGFLLLHDEFWNKIYNIYNSTYYVYPISKHELLISKTYIYNVPQIINRNDINFLSDNVYEYIENKLTIQS